VTPIIFGIRSNISSKQLKIQTSNLVRNFVLGKPSGRTNNCPQKGHGLNHVTPKFFGKRSKISSKLFELENSNLLRSFAYGMPTGCLNNFPQRVGGSGHVAPKFLAYDRTYLHKLLELGTSNLVHSFVFGKPSRSGKSFPEKWHVVVTWPLKIWHAISLIKFGIKTANIKCKKLISLQHRVRAMKSHIQNSTNHFFWDIVTARSHCTYNPLDVTPVNVSNQIKSSNLYLNQAKAHTHRHTHAYTKHNIQ